jgi:drug/metabolite transporter (DMT)-like permease
MLMKLSAGLGVPKYEIMAIASTSGSAFIFFLAAVRSGIGKLRVRNYKGLAIFSLSNTVCFVCWLTALPRLPLADYYTVIFLMPTVVSVLAAVLLRESLGWKKLMAILAGFSGVLIAINPAARQNMGDAIGYIAVFIGMLTLSGQMVLARVLSAGESSETLAFYPRLMAFIAGWVACLAWGTILPSRTALIYCLLYGLTAVLGWLFMTGAYRRATAATVIPFQYSQIITGGLIGYFVWHEIPSPNLIAGAAIIIASGIYIALHARKVAALPAEIME